MYCNDKEGLIISFLISDKSLCSTTGYWEAGYLQVSVYYIIIIINYILYSNNELIK